MPVLVGTSVCYPGLLRNPSIRGHPPEEDGDEDGRSRVRARTSIRRLRHEPGPAGADDGGSSAKTKSGRESIESFVVVFVSFLIWSLEAEGFVIPTGSMAPTLMGRHKEIVCPQCGYVYTVNADREVEPTGSGASTGRRIESGTCENCRFECHGRRCAELLGRSHLRDEGRAVAAVPGEPGRVKLKRWDVAVFKLPEEPEVRYIKRLVGMPNEVIRIEGGDLWVRPLDRLGLFERLRRPLDHQQAMQMMVYDDAHRAAALADDPRWLRWAAAPAGEWTEPAPGRFVPDRARRRLDRAAVPSPRSQPRAVGSDPRRRCHCRVHPVRRLITDYNSYNTDVSADDRVASPQRGPSVVPAALGRRLDALAASDRARAGRPVSTGADQSRRFQSLRDRPGDRRGAALSRNDRPGRSGPDRDHAGRDVRARRSPMSTTA